MEKESTAGFNWSDWQTEMVDEAFNNVRRLANIPDLGDRVKKVRKGVTPKEIVYEEDRVKLFRYLGGPEKAHKTPLLIVFALVNRPYIVDLIEGRSVVANFVNAGFDTYLMDWGIPTGAERFLTTDDYLNGYLDNAVDYLRERVGVEDLSIMGYCMGGTLSTMYTAIHQEKVRNLILLATGIDFSKGSGLIGMWTNPEYFDVDRFVDTMGNVPAEFLQSAFLMLKPIQNLVEKPLNFWENLHKEKFLDDFFAMETWLNDNVPVPGEVYREFAKYLFQQNLLVKNRMPVGKHTVNLKNIVCPFLNLMAEKDDLVPCAQSSPLNDLIGSTDKQSIVLPAGHIGLAVGSRAQKELWPRVCQWLGERSEPV